MKKAMQSGRLNRLRKKIACGVLGCLLAVGTMLMPETGMTAQAADFEINGVKYDIQSDGTCIVSFYDPMKIGSEVYIPAKIDYNGNKYLVRMIGIRAFLGCRNLSKITLEEGMETIGHAAFAESGIKETEIPATVTDIGDYAFASSYLTKISFRGKTPPNIKEYAFNKVNNIVVQIPEGANKAAWETVLQNAGLSSSQYTIQIGTPSSGSDSASTSTSTSTSTEQGGTETTEEEPVNRIPEHVCQYEWETVREAGAGQDGLEQYLCKLCGSVQSTLTIPASQYQVQELYTNVTAAAEGETVTYDMGQIHTVCDKLFTKLQERSDVTLILTYRYKGADHRTTFPAGADYTELMADEKQFYGMLGLNGHCGIVTE